MNFQRIFTSIPKETSSSSPSRPVRRPVLAFIAAAFTSVTLLSACTAAEPTSTAPATGGSVFSLLSTDPNTIDPAKAVGQDDYVLNRLLFDTVLRRDDEGITGGIASEWEAISASEYRLTVRDDATCDDGTPITATVVANSLKYLAAPETKSLWRALVFGAGVPAITSDDEAGTVEITLSTPYANLLTGLTAAQTGIICPAGLADLAGLAVGSVPGAFSGPYTLTKRQPGIGYTLGLRDDYDAWPKFAEALVGAPADVIEFGIATDEATTANQLLSGDLDIAQLQSDSVDRFASQDEFTQIKTVYASVYVTFNQRPGHPFAGKPELRKAVAQAIDRDAFNTVFSSGRSEVFSSVVAPSYPCVNKDEDLLQEQDSKAAAQALDGQSVRLPASNAFGDNGAGAEYLYEVLTKAGMDVDLKVTDNATWGTTVTGAESNWDLTIVGDINAVQLMSASLDRVMGKPIEQGGRSIGAADNEEGAALLQEALATTDEKAQCDAFLDAQRTMLERVDVVPLAGWIRTTITAPDVTVRAFGDYLDFATIRVIG